MLRVDKLNKNIYIVRHWKVAGVVKLPRLESEWSLRARGFESLTFLQDDVSEPSYADRKEGWFVLGRGNVDCGLLRPPSNPTSFYGSVAEWLKAIGC